MKKGSYTIQEGYGGGGGVKGGGVARPADSSFSACLLALLFFLALCIVIMLAAWPWGRDEPRTSQPAEEGERPQHEGHMGGKPTDGPLKGEEDARSTGAPPGYHTTPSIATTPPSGDPRLTASPTSEEEVPDYDTEPPITEGGGHNATKHHAKGTKDGHPAKEGHDTGSAEWYGSSSTPSSESGGKSDRLRQEDSALEDSVSKTDPAGEGAEAELEGGEVTPSSSTEIPSPRISSTDTPTSFPTSPVSSIANASTVDRSPILDLTNKSHADTNSSSTHNHSLESPVKHPASLTSVQLEDSVPKADPTGEGRKSETSEQSTVAPEDSEGSRVTRGSPEEPRAENASGAVGATGLAEKDGEEGAGEERACETLACKSLSSHVLSLMDHGADPCKDFYAYSCGGMRGEGGRWITEETAEFEPFSRIEDMKRRINDSSPVSLRKFKSFYDDCIHYDFEVPKIDREIAVRNILGRVGKLYNVLDHEPYNGNFTELLGNLLSYHFSPILDILLDVDSNNNSKFALKLSLPVHKSPFGYLGGMAKEATLRGWQRSFCLDRATGNPKNGRHELNFTARYWDYINCTNDLSEYLKEVNMTLQKLNLFGNLDPINATHNIQEILSTLEGELGKEIQKLMPSPYEKERASLEKDFMEYKFKDLQEKFTSVEWNALISKLINNDVPEDTTVHVYFDSYFESIFTAMDAMDGKKLNNALMAMFAHELYHGLVLDRNSCSREGYCLFVSVHLMEEASSALFLKSFHPEQLAFFQSKINSTFHELISTLESEVTSIPWLERDSKDEILDKVSKMRVIADGGASIFLNDHYLDSQFDELAMDSNYLEKAVTLLQRYRKKMYLSFGKDPSEPEQIWSNFLEPYSLHGIAVYGLNIIVVPYGMMGRPFFSEDFPEYFQMAGLGNLIAREIWLHFGKTGMLYHSDGSKGNFWGPTVTASMKSIATCLEGQKKGERTDDAGDGTNTTYELNSFLTTSSRLADIGAAHLAYKWTWRNKTDGERQAPPLPWSSMTPKQLYFIAIAQRHCTKSSIYDYAVSIFEGKHLPPFMRVNDIASNSREFASAFSCPREHEAICDPFTLATAAEDEESMPPIS